MIVVFPRAIAALTASKTTAAGSPSGLPDTIGTPTRSAHRSSCSMAAARKVSAAARSGRSPASFSRFASFAAVVVFPLPLTPTTRMTRGFWPCPRSRTSPASAATRVSRTAASAFGIVCTSLVVKRSRSCAMSGSTSDTERSDRNSASSSASSHSEVRGCSPRPKRRARNPPRVLASPCSMLTLAGYGLARPFALRVEIREAQRDHLRHAGVVHRDAVQHVGGLDRSAVVRDHDELGSVGELAERLREPADVAFVERSVDLVKHAERRRSHAQDGEEQCGRGEGALATGELREAPDPLARRSRVDVDARIFRIFSGPQRRLASIEEALEEDTEFAVDGLQRRAELLRDRPREVVRQCSQVGHRALEIRLLCREELMTLADLRELARGKRVHRFERDEPSPKALESGDGARLLPFIGLLIERDARRIGKRLVLRQAELCAHLLLEEAQRSGGALLFNRELSALPAKLREALARFAQALL